MSDGAAKTTPLAAVDEMLGFVELGLDRIIPQWVSVDSTLPVLHLGPGNKRIWGTLEYDWPAWDADEDPLPFRDGEVGGIFATHFLEHLRDPRHILREAARVLAPECPFNILVPHAESRMYLQDLDHKSPFVLETWRVLIDNPYYNKDNNKEEFPYRIGANFAFALKEDNLAIVTQLIRRAGK